MESANRKRKGFVKGKLVMMSFYRATSKQPPFSSTTGHAAAQYNTSKVKPSPVIPSSRGYIVNQQLDQHAKQRVVSTPSSTAAAAGTVEFIVNQEKVTPQPNQRVSILLQESSLDSYVNVDSLYATVAADEGVDLKAASYISSVRERIRLQRTNSEHKKFQDMQH